MSAVVLSFPRRYNIVDVQAAKGGFEITHLAPNGRRTYLGTSPNLAAARSVAAMEAFRIGRCRVRVLALEGRL